MFGYSAEEMIGQSIRRIIPRDRWNEEDEVLARIRSGRSIEHFETLRQRKDGSMIEISLSVSPIKTSTGAIIGARRSRATSPPQRRLAREAEEANRVKDEFLAMLSHELRTPLNAVLGYTRMLREGHLGPDRRERAIETIDRNANLLAQLVADVLDVSSIVTGKVRMKMATCDLTNAGARARPMSCDRRRTRRGSSCASRPLRRQWPPRATASAFSRCSGTCSATP
jgi:signal transduction histidine kinase